MNWVSVWVTVTVTPGSTAPLSSRTEPLSCAVACAQETALVRRMISAIPNPLLATRIVAILPVSLDSLDAKLHDPRSRSSGMRDGLRARRCLALLGRGLDPVALVVRVLQVHEINVAF